MVPCRVRRPLLVALLSLLALAPSVGQPLPILAATNAFTVTSTADSHDAAPGDGSCMDAASQCTLRAAIEEANAQPQGSTVTITIPAGTYLLPLGTLVVTHNALTLAGAGARTTTLDGDGQQVLVVGAAAFATIAGVTLRNGNAGGGAGGGLANLGVTVLSRSAIVSDTAKSGGGVYNAPTARLWVLRSAVVSDTVPYGWGGGIANQGILSVSGTVLSGNSAQVGGAIASTGTLTLTTSSVTTNTALISSCCYGGGGIYTSGTATVSRSVLSGNAALAGDGGGIDNDGNGILVVMTSTLSSNRGTNGILVVMTSTLSSNRGTNGGGIHNADGQLNVSGSTLSSNATSSGGFGGGIDNTDGLLLLSNSTLSGNTGFYGAGLNNGTGGMSNVTYSTISSNIGAYGAGIDSNRGFVALRGTIVANSPSNANCFDGVYDGVYSLDSGTSCGFILSNTNPLLGPLTNNGGPTQTMALLPGSPGIDHGGTSANGCPATDQRGVTRPQGPACDIGAYEAVPVAG